MSNYIYGITTAEIMSILVCVILLCYCVFEKKEKEKTRRDKLFVLLLVSCVAALVADALSWILDGNIRLLPVLYICTTLATLMSFVLICEFIIFLTSYIREKQEISLLFEYIYMVFTLAAIIFVVVTSINGKLFTYENGVYADGPWYTAYVIINIVAMLLSLVVFFTYRKSLSQHDFIATLPYIILPCIAAAINAIVPEFSYAYPAVTLALVVVYIMLQINDEIQKEVKAREALEDAKIAAESANRAKTAFLFNMSHDIRTPMNAILGYTDVAIKHRDDQARVDDSLEKIKIAGGHLLGLINDILEMSRIESDKLEITEEPADIRKLIEGVAQMTDSLAITKSIDFQTEVENITDPFVYTDELHANEVLINITSNAIKYTPEGGKVRFKVDQLSPAVDGKAVFRFVVEDDGIGMSDEFQQHLFEAFSRERTSTVSKQQGAGLGLSIVKKIVDLAGGTISVNSRQNEGSTFTVEMPVRVMDEEAVRKYEEDNRPPEIVEKEFSFENRKVLLVEDNEMNREIATEILEDAGLTVDTAEDGAFAVKAVEENGLEHYDFILMDIQMPVMDGYEATKAIRAMPGGDKVTIIAVSANAFEDDVQKSLSVGMNAHVAKPIDVNVLFDTMRELAR